MRQGKTTRYIVVAAMAMLLLYLGTPVFAGGSKESASSAASTSAAGSGGGLGPGGFPDKPITLIVPWGAGGGADTTARAFAAVAGKYFGQPIVPVLKPGAAGTIAHAQYLKEKPDGYTLIITGNSPIVTVPVFRKVPYNPLTDFIFIARLTDLRNVLAVYKDEPYKTLKDFIDYAKAHPGAIKVGDSGTQGIGDMTIKLMELKMGIKLTPVPFTTSGGAVVAAAGGHINALSGSLTSASTQIEAGNLIPLAVSAYNRSPNYPKLPTFIDDGYNVAIDNQIGIGALKGTPQPIVDFINKAIQETLADPSYKSLAKKMEMTIDYLGPADFLKSIKTSIASVKEAAAAMKANQ